MKPIEKLPSIAVFLIIWIALVIGWASNIWKLVTEWGVATDGESFVRLVGIIFYPLGAIIGWF